MSEENNIYENNNEEIQYTQAPEPDYTQALETTINGEVYTGGTPDYSSGKGQGKGLGIASMVCGILSILTICCMAAVPFLVYAPVVLGIVAIVLGIVQLVKNESKGMAIAGIICGIVGILIFIAFLVIGLAGMAMLSEMGLDGTESVEEILNMLETYE